MLAYSKKSLLELIPAEGKLDYLSNLLLISTGDKYPVLGLNGKILDFDFT